MYYLRSRPAADPIKFTIDMEAMLKDTGDLKTSINQFNIYKKKTKKVKRKVKVKVRRKKRPLEELDG